MANTTASPFQRGRSAAIAAALTLALGYALVAGLATRARESADTALRLFEVTPPPPPPPRPEPLPQRAPRSRPEGEASPPNLRSEATQVVALEPQIAVPVPPTVVTAPEAGSGSDASTGSADVPGPGRGSGGFGDGRGSGGRGEGDGAGGAETPPKRTGGRIRGSDYPEALADAGIGGTVGVRYLVARDGRVEACAVTHSSGSAELDALTCRLIRERFRFRPSRDARGRPVPAIIVENHSWEVQREPAPPPPPPRRRPGLFG